MGDTFSKAIPATSSLRSPESITAETRPSPVLSAASALGKKRKLDDAWTVVKEVKYSKLRSTSEYIYDNLFNTGEGSDVVVTILGKDFHLHKFYLKQSAYFNALLSNEWNKSSSADDSTSPNSTDDVERYSIELLDPFSTLESVEIVLSGLYYADLKISPENAVSVIATATYFQLLNLASLAADLMMNCFLPKYSISWYNACSTYGLVAHSQRLYNWLLLHLFSLVMDNQIYPLSQISESLMLKLVTDDALMVSKIEMDLYSMLKAWLYCRLNVGNDNVINHGRLLQVVVLEFFSEYRRLTAPDAKYLLDIPELTSYREVFRKGLRLAYIVNDQHSLRRLYSDCVLPEAWVTNSIVTVHRVNLGLCCEERGTYEDIWTVSEEQFRAQCSRSSRVIDRARSWRWTGHHFGLDLVFTYFPTVARVTMRRNVRSQPCYDQLNCSGRRKIYYRMQCIKMDDSGAGCEKVSHHLDTGVCSVVLCRDQLVEIAFKELALLTATETEVSQARSHFFVDDAGDDIAASIGPQEERANAPNRQQTTAGNRNNNARRAPRRSTSGANCSLPFLFICQLLVVPNVDTTPAMVGHESADSD